MEPFSEFMIDLLLYCWFLFCRFLLNSFANKKNHTYSNNNNSNNNNHHHHHIYIAPLRGRFRGTCNDLAILLIEVGLCIYYVRIITLIITVLEVLFDIFYTVPDSLRVASVHCKMTPSFLSVP